MDGPDPVVGFQRDSSRHIDVTQGKPQAGENAHSWRLRCGADRKPAGRPARLPAACRGSSRRRDFDLVGDDEMIAQSLRN